ncbi:MULTISPECIES: F0F1 ATP synthase subunit delta [unclassified Halomonas]|uniref:F0F1 ATP synthase subunit delta n=1 Tax=Halomonas sp. N3-2A TaxID=2014541 RepID=UPI000B5B2932|nr:MULTISPECIES: F0F1 ATP synthase subunit delta [unclassified Halomonas]ASK18069.1 F0F1 ATP synthase subunit B [Halomonas sp. N3-2A]UTD55455.1 F0F1 ATP synthase subunit delta [Halomonas sp. MS1]
MSIDWVTVLAQIANFLVLVWLLKRFLYKPILNGIDSREAEIAEQMGEAARAQQKAEAAEVDFVTQKQQLLADQTALEAQVRQEAEQKRNALLVEARETLEQERLDLQAHLAREQERFTTELYKASAETLYQLASRALHDLADERLEARIALHVISQLAPPLSEELAAAASNAQGAVVTTHAPLPEGARQEVEAALQGLVPGLSLRFATDDSQSPGMVLRIGSIQLDWTVDSYTDELVGLLEERLASGESGRVHNYGG